MHLERMKRLVDVLGEVASNQSMRNSFNLDSWITIPDVVKPEDKFAEALRADKDLKGIPHNCGTTACAVGYAGLDEGFREEGFITSPYGTVQYTINKDEDSEEVFGSWEAVERFFEISPFMCEMLFSAHSYNVADNVNRVRDRIIQFIREEDKSYDPDDDYLV